MHSLVPANASISVLLANWLLLNTVFFKNIEKRLVTSVDDRFELVVIPHLSVHIFAVGVEVSTKEGDVAVSTVFADESSEPEETMCGGSLLAVNAVFVEWVGEVAFQEFSQGWWLWQVASAENMSVVRNQSTALKKN